MYFSTIWTLCKTLTKRYFRDPVALFFTLVFPLIFLLVFGTISRSSSVSFNVVVLNHSDTQFAADFAKQTKDNKVFGIKSGIKNFADAKRTRRL